MGVQIFTSAQDYKNWVDYYASNVTVISVLSFNDQIVVTYARD